MPLIKRVKSVYLFENGNLAVFDRNGEQICELQGLYSLDKHKRIMLEASDDCEFNGFHILPSGFKQTVVLWLTYFADKHLSWEEITSI